MKGTNDVLLVAQGPSGGSSGQGKQEKVRLRHVAPTTVAFQAGERPVGAERGGPMLALPLDEPRSDAFAAEAGCVGDPRVPTRSIRRCDNIANREALPGKEAWAQEENKILRDVLVPMVAVELAAQECRLHSRG